MPNTAAKPRKMLNNASKTKNTLKARNALKRTKYEKMQKMLKNAFIKIRAFLCRK